MKPDAGSASLRDPAIPAPSAVRAFSQDLRWRCAALVFAVLAAVGAACALWAVHELRSSSLQLARDDARALAQSVAQMLAQQLGRAVRLGIPLAELPGVAAYLQTTLQQRPALTHIAVEAADGSVLHGARSAVRSAPDQAGSVRVAIGGAGDGGTAGTVEVGVDAGVSVRRGLVRAAWQSAALVLGLAGLAAWLAAAGPGARMERQRRQVLQRLHCASAELPPQAEPAGLDAVAAAPGLPALAQALARGDAQVLAARRAVQDYGQELLAMDFDGRLRADIERCLAACAVAASAPQAD